MLVIDLDLRVRMIVQYPVSVGHNYYEVTSLTISARITYLQYAENL